MLNCTPIEYCMGNISGLSDSELSQVVTAVQKEQNARKGKKRQELINKAVAALHDLQNECPEGEIRIECQICGSDETYLTFKEVADLIKLSME